MKVSFILLAHEAPEHLQPVIETLLASGSDVYIHHDAKAPFDLRRAADTWDLNRFHGQLFHADRVHVSWGEWSIVQATLNCMRLARQHGYNADYFMLLSGSCMPIKPIHVLESFLQKNNGTDFIEVVNARQHRWVTGGIQQERWEQFHYVNWRAHPTLFSTALDVQKKLGIKRRIPLGHTPFMGSQWWCLRATTVDSILALIDKHPKLERFYHRTWVPDELFFQTMVGNIIPAENIRTEILSRYKFNSWGIPRVYYDDDAAELVAETTYFARKISHRAPRLKKTLQQVCSLDKSEYHKFINDPNNAHLTTLNERQRLKEEIKKAAWFSLITAQENEYDYIKSIPNPMVAIVSGNKEASTQLLNEFRQIKDTAVFGNLLGQECIDFGSGITTYAGYNADSVTRAHHKWHLFLGEIAFHAQGTALIFALDENPLFYLNVLRWKTNLTVIVIDEPKEDLQRGCNLDSLCVRSAVSLFLAKDAACRFVRLHADDYSKITRMFRGLPMNIDELWTHLNEARKIMWPSLQPEITGRYEFLKSIPNPMVVVCAPDKISSEAALNVLAQHDDIACFSGNILFTKTDWYFAIGDIAHCSPHRMLAFALNPENIFYIETLRWKLNCTILVIEESLQDEKYENINLPFFQKKELAKSTIIKELSILLEDKFCKAYVLGQSDSHLKMRPGILHINSVDEFNFHFNPQKYIKFISNQIITIICGNNEIEGIILDEFRHRDDVAVLDNFFSANLPNPQDTSKTGQTSNEDSLMFYYTALQNLKQRALQEKNKALVFTIPKGHALFLNLLTAKNDTLAIVVDEPIAMRKNGSTMETLSFRSQACRQLSHDTSCRFMRISSDTLFAATKKLSSQKMNISLLWEQISATPMLNWPSLQPGNIELNDFLNLIPNPMIVICAPNEDTRISVFDELSKHPYINTFPGKILSHHDNWGRVIGDISCYSPEHALAISIDDESISYLEILQKKENCAILIINDTTYPSGKEQSATDAAIFFKKIKMATQDKVCETFFLDKKRAQSFFGIENGSGHVKNLEEFLTYFTLKYNLEKRFKMLTTKLQ